MKDKKCIGIDCAWCVNPECPNEKKDINRQKIVDAFKKAYNKYFEDISKHRWIK